MFFIFGQRWKTKPFGQIDLPCPRCNKNTMHTAQLLKGKFTLFFIPIATVWGKQYQVVCNICGYKRKAAGELKNQLMALEKKS
jgi:zinc-ribbon family